MDKLSSLKKKKWLKDRRRTKKIKKQHNYESKTHKGTNPFYLSQNLINRSQEEKKQKKIEQNIRKKILGKI